MNGTLYFSATNGTNGQELWKSDAGGTAMVADINPNAASSTPRFFTCVNGTVYFAADDGTHGLEVWKTDGTAEGDRHPF